MEPSLGNSLRDARESSGLTVDDAVYRAKIPRAVVEALEADDLSFFTSPLYARSFLKQYGDYIGADVSPWIGELVPVAMIDPVAVENFINLAEAENKAPRAENLKPRTSGGGGMAAASLLMITGVMIWAGVTFFRDLEQQHTEKPTVPGSKPNQETSQAEPPDIPEEKPAPSRVPETPQRAIIVDVSESE